MPEQYIYLPNTANLALKRHWRAALGTCWIVDLDLVDRCIPGDQRDRLTKCGGIGWKFNDRLSISDDAVTSFVHGHIAPYKQDIDLVVGITAEIFPFNDWSLRRRDRCSWRRGNAGDDPVTA